MDAPIVQVQHGLLLGSLQTTPSALPYYSFQGIRYAKPPLLDRRFKGPEEPDNWKDLYNATYERNICLQLDSHNNVVGDEDCLFLNVYTPRLPSKLAIMQMLLPVMVWIHGGGFVVGSGSVELFGPDFIVENDVILVTMNYRLGVMGFMNLGVEGSPGNAGLKDQVMTLKWVKENIKKFSGDPSKVTIFGESAGGASVQLLMLSPMAKGLFHRVISHSGSCLSSWSFIPEHEDLFERAYNVAKLSGRTSKNATKLLEILRGLSGDILVRSSNKLRSFDDRMRDAAFVFAPSVEKKSRGEENFINRSPIDIFMSGHFNAVPYISGYNSEEGIYYINYARHNVELIDTLNKNFQYVVPNDMNLNMDSDDSEEVARLLRAFYFHGEKIDNSTMDSFIDLYTDYAFLYKILLSSEIIRNSSKSPVYLYKFAFDGDFNYFKKKNNLNYSGACHLDDLGYIFREKVSVEYFEQNLTKSEMVRKQMVAMWTNFAKFGNPTLYLTNLLPLIWQPVNAENFDFLKIGDDLEMLESPEEKRMRFWKKLYDSFSNSTKTRADNDYYAD